MIQCWITLIYSLAQISRGRMRDQRFQPSRSKSRGMLGSSDGHPPENADKDGDFWMQWLLDAN